MTTTSSHSHEGRVILAAILASSMAFIDSSALNVALPILQGDLGMNGSQLLWVVNAYALFLSALILVGGSLGDIYGRKRIFMIGIGLFAVASLACGLAPDANLLIIARAIQGIGGALMVPGSLALITSSVAPERRGAAIGTWSTFSTLTTLGGPALGGWLAQAGLWRFVFFINLPLAAFALYILVTGVPESRDSSAPPHLDYVGALLVTLGLAGLTYGFIEAPSQGWGSPIILITLIGGFLALVLFVIVESRTKYPMVPLRLFRSRTFSGTNALTLFLYAALSALPFFNSLNLVQIQGYPPDIAGLTFLPFGILLSLLSRRMGRLADRLGPRPLLTVGPFIAGVGFLMFAFAGQTNGPASYWTTFFPAIVVLGVGMGITVAPLTTAVMGAAPAESSGTASGINNAVARTAGVLAIAILGALALTTFGGFTMTQLRDEGMNFSEAQMDDIRSEINKLADAQVPASIPAENMPVVEDALKASFINTFNLMAVICAVLAWISAALAFILVDRRKPVGAV